jgi:hypothetical protein
MQVHREGMFSTPHEKYTITDTISPRRYAVRPIQIPGGGLAGKLVRGDGLQ